MHHHQVLHVPRAELAALWLRQALQQLQHERRDRHRRRLAQREQLQPLLRRRVQHPRRELLQQLQRVLARQAAQQAAGAAQAVHALLLQRALAQSTLHGDH